MIVVDASVAAKWLLPEPGQASAEAVLREPSGLCAPALVRLEVSAAICRRVRAGAMSPEVARERFGNWLALLRDGVLLLLPDEDLLASAVALSVELKHGLQDCLYLAAAIAHASPLVTSDKRFHAIASGRYPAIRLVGDSLPH